MSSGETNMNDQGGAGAGEDLSAALAGGETEFVATEEKKPVVTQGMMYLLLLLAVGGGGTYYMYQRSGGPSSAAAATTAETAKAQQTITTFLASGSQGMKNMESMLKDTEKVVQQFNDYPSVTQVPLSGLQTNPFKFAKADGASSAKADEEAAKKKREEELQAGLKASQALNLQSIIHSGTRKACMINNTLYMEGQQVEQFTIEKINPGSVVLRTGAFRYERKMQRN
jgi:hypothetical protein